MIPSPSPLSVTPAPESLTSADLYIRVREKEGRLYPDETVSRLPDVPPDHPLRQEWLARADSARRLLDYLRGLGRPLQVLDVGCGNGWLSRLIARTPDTRVWGLDRPGPELFQAARLFATRSLGFFIADVSQAPLPPRCFDIVLLASVIQYFPDLAGTLRQLRLLLRPGGEIHILDSPLYSTGDLETARQRTEAYYSALGFPEMAASYSHHNAASLMEFEPHYLYQPYGLGTCLSRRLRRAASPFPWIRIRQAS